MNIRTRSILVIIAFLFSCDDIGIDNENVDKNQGFIRSFGTSWYEYGWGITQLHDGGFVVTGRKEYKSNNTKDMITIRTDEKGFGLWERTYGGSKNEEGYTVVETPDGHILSIGYSWSYGNAQEIFIVKTDFYGKEIWRKTYGGRNRDIGHKAIVTSDGHIVIVGQTNSPGISHGNDDVWLSKIDQDGNQKWFKAYGELNHEIGYDVVEIDGGGFLIVGYREFYSAAGKDLLIIKTDAEGNQLWDKTIGVDGNYEEIAYSISKSKNNGYLICAATNASGNTWYNPQVINIDFDGNIIWNKSYNGSGLKHTRWVATATNDGGAAIVGTTNYFRESGRNEDAYLMKIDHAGKKLWDTAVQGGKNDWGWAVIETFFRELVIVGSTKSYGSGLYDILLVEITKPIED
ncbi:MAG: hypothetical protein HOK52_00025 [Candidatus Marinimicrobia bacterium]|jgi:hypothetical protein|nr:hypothetical protein [Candidatus Neomarinimicrobiota bacterium]MBT4636178.1 hypothetical protein [Candidatus Neomarinimicrobiota bacterium]MBT5069863.1 hypothetical protein [Candidatus Neomarinimicrobiota bacterium]MBT5758452.1 hypothetical protein [Candidatus Neomarinimicrobiota bacterium]MBT6469628.1 hypothetical protein [Candidatus Neomarinimicrobiota bacterium]